MRTVVTYDCATCGRNEIWDPANHGIDWIEVCQSEGVSYAEFCSWSCCNAWTEKKLRLERAGHSDE